jgi:hypothetical protein
VLYPAELRGQTGKSSYKLLTTTVLIILKAGIFLAAYSIVYHFIKILF